MKPNSELAIKTFGTLILFFLKKFDRDINSLFDSNSGGTSIISSSGDTELFGLGLLTNVGPTEFKVRAMSTQSFSDIPGNTAPNQSSNTFTTQSYLDLSNGAFGDRLYNMTKVFQCNSKILDYEWGKEYILDDIEKIFREDLQIENVLTCWVETSTGVLNPIDELSDLCQKYNKKLSISLKDY